ncbi:tRNA lysidine(34) synthetase TilS [Pseudoxanthomonas putridarboris]|uniref:tRNA(Ile)-lysidine synthase n=1 Tax=Pseudoxanthomonas putridarboris TaxID=752605 RepID=A0ABU9IY56_9GAMM
MNRQAPSSAPLRLPAPARQAPVCVGFSGGLDSWVLLHALANDAQQRRHGLRAVHVHHGLHAQADDWAAHCQRMCDALGIGLLIVRVHVERDSGDGPEAAARRARHRAFADALDPGDILATAHHRDDQAETFLLRALRASGPDGLAAMRPWRAFAGGWQWRPLLDTPRAALLAYARQHALTWIEDPSNQRLDFDRNFLRHQVMPLLRQRWPHADETFARSAMLCGEASDLLTAEDAAALAQARTADPAALRVDVLATWPASRRARVLRLWVEQNALPPLPAEGVAHIETDLLTAGPDARAEFAWQGAVIRRWRGLLHAERQRPALAPDWQAEWDGRGPLALPDDGALALEGAADAFDAPLRLTARHGGERITLPGRSHSHALKDVLQTQGIPPWERRRLPLLWAPDGALWAVGDLVLSDGCDAWLRQRGARLHWRRG